MPWALTFGMGLSFPVAAVTPPRSTELRHDHPPHEPVARLRDEPPRQEINQRRTEIRALAGFYRSSSALGAMLRNYACNPRKTPGAHKPGRLLDGNRSRPIGARVTS